MGCGKPQKEASEEDIVLARAHNRVLHQSEVADLIPPGLNREDSALRVNAHIERWVREALLMHEAERNIPKDLNIDQLVRDYRASLVLHNYEQQLILNTMDSTIAREQLQAHYEEHKNQYSLQEDIAQLYFLRIPLELEEKAELEELWKNIQNENTRAELAGLCREFQIDCFLEDERWVPKKDAVRLFPEGTLSEANLRSGQSFRQTDSLFQYHMHIKSTLATGEISPLPYIEGQIKQVILHRRQLNILEERAEELYELESRRGNVEIY